MIIDTLLISVGIIVVAFDNNILELFEKLYVIDKVLRLYIFLI